MQIPASIRDLVAQAPVAYLTTLNADGSPQLTMVWVGIEGDEFVIGHMGEWKKVQNVKREPRVAAALLQRLAHVYMGPDVAFPPEGVRDRPGVITRITPDRFSGIGPWAERQG